MKDFGFGISPSSRIDLDKAPDMKFRLLAETEPDVLICMGCGSCAASCTAGIHTSMNLRRTILLLSRGEEKDALRHIEDCMLCGKCMSVCPRGINTRHLLASVLRIYQEQNR